MVRSSTRRMAIGAALCGLGLMQAAHAQAGKSSDVVYLLYRDYGWEALFAAPDDGGAALGRPLLAQPRGVLSRYFDDALVSLLLQEQACLAQHVGEVCNLDFNPIFASQDPAASDLQIGSRRPAQVDVQFVYPSTRHTVRLEYRMVRTRAGWRIDDIRYPATETSSRTLLAPADAR